MFPSIWCFVCKFVRSEKHRVRNHRSCLTPFSCQASPVLSFEVQGKVGRRSHEDVCLDLRAARVSEHARGRNAGVGDRSLAAGHSSVGGGSQNALLHCADHVDGCPHGGYVDLRRFEELLQRSCKNRHGRDKDTSQWLEQKALRSAPVCRRRQM